jgi:hypothetical protein
MVTLCSVELHQQVKQRLLDQLFVLQYLYRQHQFKRLEYQLVVEVQYSLFLAHLGQTLHGIGKLHQTV